MNARCRGRQVRLAGLHRFSLFAGFALGLTALGACETLWPPLQQPVTVGEVVAMSKADVPPQRIINKMADSGTVYRLSDDEYARLAGQGVSGQVIDYMQQTYRDALRRDQTLQQWDQWTREEDGYWYGGQPYGWSAIY